MSIVDKMKDIKMVWTYYEERCKSGAVRTIKCGNEY